MFLIIVILLAGLLSYSWTGVAASSDNQLVIIPIKGTIEPGLTGFVSRSLDKAYQQGAKKVIFEIDTPGGLINSAQQIKTEIFSSKLPTIAYVSGEAKSAGVLITLAAERVYMNPTSSIGAAEPVPNTEKIRSSWRSDLEAAAEARGRRADIVAGMVDKALVIENIKKQGELVSLTANRAVEYGIADQIISNRTSLINELAQKDGVEYSIVEMTPGWGEKLTWWIINPYVAPILLLIGFAGLILEAFTPGWGVGGTVGLVALGIFFGGHMMAGVTGWFALFVFIMGFLALLLEILVIPGFGVSGLIGLGLVVWGILLASTSLSQAVISLSVAFFGSLLLLYILVKVLGRRGIWNSLILGTKLDSASGYNSPKIGLEKYLGLTGTAITPLRPSGHAELGTERVDVVTEGGFVASGSPIQVIMVEGTRVVVKEIEKYK